MFFMSYSCLLTRLHAFNMLPVAHTNWDIHWSLPLLPYLHGTAARLPSTRDVRRDSEPRLTDVVTVAFLDQLRRGLSNVVNLTAVNSIFVTGGLNGWIRFDV